ncbi:alpha/beta fold hydrolase [Noviherbaspirillum soli]|uniref:alpha/beta fold hydrolase n=1 Tax=Noviherbaspirillum soli TaxID=1064518 RepID=UPI00188BC5CD|nr:alpha/beta hydrolase [Noviherbaspirillum soli]
MRSIFQLTLLLLAVFTPPALHAAAHCGVQRFPDYQLEYCMYPAAGPLLVLDAAQGTSMQVWDRGFIGELNRYASVLTYNRIGSGRSRFNSHPLTQPVTARDSAERLHHLLQRIAPSQRIILLGHSMGGLYAQYFAHAYPQQLLGLVLIDAASAFEPRTDSPFENRSPIRKGSVSYFEELGFVSSVKQIEENTVFPDIPLLVISADNHQFPAQETEALWQEIQKKIARQSPTNRQVTVPDSQHFVFNSNRDTVVREIAAMIRNRGFKQR